jgi:hypothetical protein
VVVEEDDGTADDRSDGVELGYADCMMVDEVVGLKVGATD